MSIAVKTKLVSKVYIVMRLPKIIVASPKLQRFPVVFIILVPSKDFFTVYKQRKKGLAVSNLPEKAI